MRCLWPVPRPMRSLLFLALAPASCAILSPPVVSQEALRQRLKTPLVAFMSDIAWFSWCRRNSIQTLQLGRDVEVRPTGDVRGQGLYAMHDLEAGVVINRYTGKWLTDDDYTESDGDGAYAFALTNGYTIDGEDPKRSSYVRFINHSVRRANCEALQAFEEGELVGAVYLETARSIQAGEELLFDYGADYWDERARRFTPQRIKIDYL